MELRTFLSRVFENYSNKT